MRFDHTECANGTKVKTFFVLNKMFLGQESVFSSTQNNQRTEKAASKLEKWLSLMNNQAGDQSN